MLPDGITVEVIVVNQVNAGHLFVQQHTHPTFHALRSLDQQMYLCYSQPGIPTLPTPVESKQRPEGSGRGTPGVACSAWILIRRRLFWDPSWKQHSSILAIVMELGWVSWQGRAGVSTGWQSDGCWSRVLTQGFRSQLCH